MSFISRETEELLNQYVELLIKWNKTINLVSKYTISEFWQRHILDSLQLLEYIGNKNISLIDIGSGAGLPGIILSIAGIEKVTLVESDIRKCVFLYQASKISNNQINILNNRIEKIYGGYDILTCRAFSSLQSIFLYTNQLKINQKYLLLKGKNYQKEIEEAKKEWYFNCIIQDSTTSKEGKILEISNLVKIK